MAPDCVSSSVEFAIYFDFDTSSLTETAKAVIDDAVSQISLRGDCAIEIVLVHGYADRSGEAAYNLELSERRANSVRDALIARGIPADLIRVLADGEEGAALATPDGQREPLNRRVEVLIRLQESPDMN